MWPFTKKTAQEKSIGGTWINTGWSQNWFQKGDTVTSGTALRSTAVYTCVSIIANGISRLKVKHYLDAELKGRREDFKSDIAKLFNKPNAYQNRMDFLLYLMMSLLLDGNAYAYAKRDAKGRIISLHPLNARSTQVNIVPDTGEVWYSLATNSNDLIPTEDDTFIPASNVLHLRLFTPVHPLVGVSPLIACSLSIEAGMNIQDQSNTFFANKSKPGGYLRTPNKLDPKTAKLLGKAWAEGTNGLASGKTAVLDQDLSFESIALNAVDAEIINQYKLSVTDIANVYHVPFHMVDPSVSHNFETSEAVDRAFVSSTLSFYAEYLEAGFDDFFEYDGRTEYVEFDIEESIGRGNFKDRMSAYSSGILGGVLRPNDARAKENMPDEDGGDALYMQRQNRPLKNIDNEFTLEKDKTESEIAKIDAETDNLKKPTEEPEIIVNDDISEEEAKSIVDFTYKIEELV